MGCRLQASMQTSDIVMICLHLSTVLTIAYLLGKKAYNAKYGSRPWSWGY